MKGVDVITEVLDNVLKELRDIKEPRGKKSRDIVAEYTGLKIFNDVNLSKFCNQIFLQ